MAKGVLGEIAERKRSDVRSRLAGATLDPEPSRNSLRDALARPGARFVMEVKKASPSGHKSAVGVEAAADAYAPVADAISVLTDAPFFGGSLDDLRLVRSRFDGPILAKDFIVDPRQVAEARLHGADAVLAILSMLDDVDARALMDEAGRLAMDVIVEVHDRAEVERALALGAQIVGINNRDLKTLRTDLAVTEELAALVPADRLVVSESGIGSHRDVERLAPHVDAFLVGSSLMASDDIALAARSLVRGAVKVCGLTNVDDVALAASAGATHAGMIFAEGSARRIGDRTGAALADAARRGGVRPVGVFQDQDEALVVSTARDLGLSAVQLHGREAGLDRLRALLPDDCEIWAACAVGDSVDRERTGADRILYDMRDGARSGGTGRPFDWALVEGRPALQQGFIAGGIGPANIAAARRVGSYGLDIGSAIEAAPGRKDAALLAAAFAAVRPRSRREPSCD